MEHVASSYKEMPIHWVLYRFQHGILFAFVWKSIHCWIIIVIFRMKFLSQVNWKQKKIFSQSHKIEFYLVQASRINFSYFIIIFQSHPQGQQSSFAGIFLDKYLFCPFSCEWNFSISVLYVKESFFLGWKKKEIGKEF